MRLVVYRTKMLVGNQRVGIVMPTLQYRDKQLFPYRAASPNVCYARGTPYMGQE